MNTEGNLTLEGSLLKYNLNLSLPNLLTMDDAEFTARFFIVKGKVCTVTKAEAIRIDASNYVCLVDTDTIGSGSWLKCEVEVKFPDNDTADGYRTEKTLVNVGEDIGHAL